MRDTTNEARPHQGLGQSILNGSIPSSSDGPIRKRTYLGGLLKDYYREAT
jgi:hypothetical protein